MLNVYYCIFFFKGTWSGKDVHPQEWQAPLCWRQKHHLLCSSQAGAHGHHCWECVQVCFICPSQVPYCHFAQLSTVFNTLCPALYAFQWGQESFVARLPHFVCASAEHAVWTAAEGAGRVGLFHQHRRVYPRPDPVWWRPALHGVWKCFQGVFNPYINRYRSTALLLYEWMY